jgi:ParB-like chromosome segregation protein Spo0J
MADLKQFADSRGTLLNINPRRLKVMPGLNARDANDPENASHIGALTLSIVEYGFLQSHPLTVFSQGDEVYIADGHCRLAAALRAIELGVAIETVPCVPERRGSNDVDRILNQNLQNAGKRLTPLEEGHNIKRAYSLGLSVAEIARRLGKSPSYVGELLDFQAASQEIQNQVRDGAVSLSTAAAAIKEHGVDAAEIISEAVREAGGKKVTRKSVSRIAHPPCRIREGGGGFLVVTFEGHRVIFGKKLWTHIGEAIGTAAGQEHADPVTIER